jgi:hypothetical protein
VPKQLTDDNELACMETCMQFLQHYHEEVEVFLQCIVISDETWVHHCEPAGKHHSMEWKHGSSPRTEKFKSMTFDGEMMLPLFWKFNGPIFKHSQNHGQMVNCAWYCAMLEEELKSSICNKCRRMLTNGCFAS